MYQKETGVFPMLIIDLIGLGILALATLIKDNFEIFCIITTLLIAVAFIIWYSYKLDKESKEAEREALLAQKEAELKLQTQEAIRRAEELKKLKEEKEALYLKRVTYVKETSPKIFDLIELINDTELPILEELRGIENDISPGFSIKYKYNNFRFDEYMTSVIGDEIYYFADLAKRMEEGISTLKDNIMFFDVIKEKKYDLTRIIEESNGLLTEEQYIKIEGNILNKRVVENPHIKRSLRNLREHFELMYRIKVTEEDFNLKINKSFCSPGGYKKLNDFYIVTPDDIRKYIRRAVQIREYNNTEEARRKKERRDLTLKLRYRILQRDNFKCTICGRGYEDGVQLHVDHIIPVSKGGRTEMDNLRTLCNECNFGKSDTIENEEEYKKYIEGREEE